MVENHVLQLPPVPGVVMQPDLGVAEALEAIDQPGRDLVDQRRFAVTGVEGAELVNPGREVLLGDQGDQGGDELTGRLGAASSSIRTG